MPRPRNSSYKSYNVIYNALMNGPKYFQELKDAAGLHRNTVASRLKFLESQGLVRKERRGNRVYYDIIKDQKWQRYLINKKEIRDFKRNIKQLAREQLRNTKIMAEIAQKISQFHEELDKLIEHQENQEILELIPNWQEASTLKIHIVLYLNMYIVFLNSNRQICTRCLHFGTITDHESNEIVCPKCGFVIEDEIIPPEQRLKLISKILLNLRQTKLNF